MTDLWGTGLIEGLPPAVADEPWIRIMDKVYRERHQHEMDAAERIHIYTLIDSQPEEILDVLATQFKVDWYDANYPLQAKQNIIKTALEVRRYYGTDWATLKAISAIYPRSEIEQWYDYGGTPGHFRVICSVDGALIPVKRREIRRSVNIYKRMTAHLDSDDLYAINKGERIPFRGGSWYYASSAGVFRLSLGDARSNANGNVGRRSAFVGSL